MSLEEDIGERLREAACVGDLNLVAKLASQGADINSKNSMNGWTALHWASKRNHVAVVRYLLEKGADKENLNKDENIPAHLTSNEEIRELLGAPSDTDVKKSSLPIIPNYLANPAFPYSTETNSNYSSNYNQTSVEQKVAGVDNRTGISKMAHNGTTLVSDDELVLKARLANCEEKDFIEVELSKSSLTFASLFNLLCAELGVDKNLVAKIRKLPDTVLRKDKDVQRLRDFQEIELVLTNKAMSSASRTYSIGPARNHETILY